MRVSYRWLGELLPGLEASPKEVAERLTRAGLEVEAIESFGVGLEAVRVAEVRRVEPHPTRDKLRLVTVNQGSGHEQTVVCGAANVPGPGGLVALATVGTTLPAVGLTLVPRAIGGVQSEGMLCSEQELGLAPSSEGILILPAGTAQPGTPLVAAVPAVSDTLLELGVAPNRGDALGHVGVAREVAALYGLSLRVPDVGSPRRVAEGAIRDLVRVTNRDPERCPYYGAMVVVGVKIGPSPLWLRWRLAALGLRSISNVVDITNLLLLEWGQPMHAFDLDRVRRAEIVVRRAEQGEPFVTLDGASRSLDADDLVICDGEGPSALAGIMGGQISEIREETERVLLECAYFQPRGIRRTSRRHALSTDSSYRFERGTDWGAIPTVLERAAVLLTQLAEGAVVPGAIHDRGHLPSQPAISLRGRRLDALLGAPVPFGEAVGILGRLGLSVESSESSDGGPEAKVLVPSWRSDLRREADLIEEVARIRGLDGLPTLLPAMAPQPPRTSGKLERRAAETACQLGFSEAVTYAFVSPQALAAVHAPPPVVSLKNPLSEDRTVMRTSLLPGLLDALRRARRHGERAVRLFTVATVFLPPAKAPRTGAALSARPQQAADLGVLPEEVPSLAAVLAGPRPGYLVREEVDVFDAKGLAVELVERLTQRRAQVRLAPREADTGHLHPRGAAEISVDGLKVGRFGPLHPDLVEELDLEGPAQILEVDLSAIEALERRPPQYRPVPRLPAVVRDLSLEVSETLEAGVIETALREASGELCESVELIDLFSGKPIPAGHRSLTFRSTYRDPKAATDPEHARTLTDKEVDKAHAKARTAVEKLGAVPRE